MERHLVWLVVLIVVLMVWFGLLCWAAKAKRKGISNAAIARRESVSPESPETIGNGEVSNRHSEHGGATITGSERICHGSPCGEMEQGRLSMETKAKSMGEIEAGRKATEAAIDMHKSMEAIEGRMRRSRCRCWPDGEEKAEDSGAARSPPRDADADEAAAESRAAQTSCR